MNKDGIFALYARVSSDKQAKDKTIDSQIAALKEKITADGGTLIEDMMFIDAGVTGATLVRPELERLRDSAAIGAVDRVYFLSPDRLARKYAHQALLLEEFSSAGVTVHFLNHAVGTTPEEELLLQMQGMIAEYERAKIIERHRRGKLHRAKGGSVNVLSTAPYGYIYIRKQHMVCACIRRRLVWWIFAVHRAQGEAARNASAALVCWGLPKLGLSPQRPLRRAFQCDEDKVKEWREKAYPEIQKLAKKVKATVYFGNEASVRSDYHRGTTWAPVGKTRLLHKIEVLGVKRQAPSAVRGNATARFPAFRYCSWTGSVCRQGE